MIILKFSELELDGLHSNDDINLIAWDIWHEKITLLR